MDGSFAQADFPSKFVDQRAVIQLAVDTFERIIVALAFLSNVIQITLAFAIPSSCLSA
jgi:hypothetical protein